MPLITNRTVLELPGARTRRRRPLAAPVARPLQPGIPEVAPPVRVSRRDRLTRHLLAAADLVAASVALIAVLGVDHLRLTSLVLPMALVVTCKVLGLYDRDMAVMRRSTLNEVPRLFEISGLAALLVWLLSDLVSTAEPTRVAVLACWLLTFAGTVLLRGSARAIARAATPAERCAVVGDAATIRRVARRLDASRVKTEVVAGLKVDPTGGDLPTAAEFTGWMRDNAVERLLLAPAGADSTELLDLVRIAKASGVRVSLLPRLLDVVGSSVEFEDVDGMTVLGVRSFGLTRSSKALKRGFDLVGAGLGLLAIAPLFVALAAAVKLTSRGPVFFRQARVGRDGQHFGMVKFRSMVDGADAMKDELRALNETDGLFKLTVDPRVTRIGRLLRATSLDELPQLLNVLRGEMSLVGPRPLVAEEDALVAGLDRARLQLTPGMTGPWQVLGGTRVPLREMVAIDCLYVANWSLWRDVEILVRTAVHVLRRGGV